MTSEELLEELKALAAEMGLKVRFENGNFEGGYCLLRDQNLLVINRRTSVPRKIRTLSIGLHEFGLENVFVSPALREAIEDEVSKVLQEARTAA
ncbi:MAG TPA: hypothetical protein VFO76_11875 [Candidatus Kapabacteria bacterium]|nr:hypothetical protein [Candidatus Kapabacteria bacterium]